MRTNDGHSELSFENGGYGEDPGFDIWLNAFVQPNGEPCKHAGPKQDGDDKGYRLPRLVVSWTQGGHDVTGTCADCIAETLASLSAGERTP